MYFLDFECSACGNRWEEAFATQADSKDKKKCPKCGKMGKRAYKSSIVIPEHMKAGNEVPWNYEKRGFGHKKIHASAAIPKK